MVNLHGAEEAIGSERVVGEHKLAPREPYGARRTRLREYPIPSGYFNFTYNTVTLKGGLFYW